MSLPPTINKKPISDCDSEMEVVDTDKLLDTLIKEEGTKLDLAGTLIDVTTGTPSTDNDLAVVLGNEVKVKDEPSLDGSVAPKTKLSGAQKRRRKLMMSRDRSNNAGGLQEPIASGVKDLGTSGLESVSEEWTRTSPSNSEPSAKRARESDSSVSYNLPAEKSNIAIIPSRYPSEQLSKDQSEEVKAQLINFVDMLEVGGVSPEFSGFKHHLGGCILVCDDTTTKDWVTSIVKQFSITGDVKLRTGSVDLLKKTMKVGGFFPGEKITEAQFLRRLCIQNGKVPDIDKWALIGTKYEKSGFYGVMLIPMTSIKYLERRNLMVSYGIGKVLLKVFDKKKPPKPGSKPKGNQGRWKVDRPQGERQEGYHGSHGQGHGGWSSYKRYFAEENRVNPTEENMRYPAEENRVYPAEQYREYPSEENREIVVTRTSVSELWSNRLSFTFRQDGPSPVEQ